MQLTQNYLLLLLHILKEGKFLSIKLSCLVGSQVVMVVYSQSGAIR